MEIEIENKSFQESVGPLLIFGQFFTMLPVHGILSNDVDNLWFRWASVKTIYSIIFLVFGSLESCLAMRRLFVIGFSVGYAEAILFYIFSMVRSLMIFRLAIKWKCIMSYWKSKEDVFLKKPYEIKGWSLKRKLSTVFILMVSCVIIEHILFLIYGINSNHIQIEYCNPKSKIFWDNFLSRYRPHVRHFVKYSPWQLPIYEWINLLQAFAFSYADIFIMLLSIGITTRFNQFNQLFCKIITNNCNSFKPTMWMNLRAHYIQLMDLTKFIDSHISGLVLISCAHNMLTLILKFYGAFKPSRIEVLDIIYFWFFVAFLVLRTFLGLYLIASVNEAAYKPLNYIRMISSRQWDIEMKRLQDTILAEASTIGFSGLKTFYITKRMILSIIGTIITFEIILVDAVDTKKETLCASID